MALDFISEIQEVSKVIFYMKRSLFGCNCNDLCTFSQEWNEAAEGISLLYNKYNENKNPLAEDIKRLVDTVRANTKNLVVCAEAIEEEFIPLLYKIVADAGKIDIEEGNYRFVSAKSGLINIQDLQSGKYMYSTVDPLMSTWDNASYIYSTNANNIVLMGCGLGYLAYQLWKKSFESAHIYIYEQDEKMINYARDFGALDWINPEQLTIVVEENSIELFNKFLSCDTNLDRSLFYISDWVVDSVDEKIKKRVQDYIVNQKGANRFSERFDINYYNNVDVFTGTIADLTDVQRMKTATYGDEYAVVAAGPSLNKMIDYLREIQGKKTIVAVDAVLKKLLANGIRPDYVTALDPNKSLMHYLDGIEEQTVGIPLIADSVVYWKYINNYRGPVYRVCSSDSKMNEADKEKYNIPDLGAHGTVSGLAIQIALYFGAKKIELIGLDLSYPGRQHHADGLGVDVSDETIGELSVISVTGEPVETSPTFEEFLREIEGQIASNREIVFVNKSDCGAYIGGTLCGRWYEKMPTVDEAKEYFNRLANETMITWSEKYYIVRQYYKKLIENRFESREDILNSGIFYEVYQSIKKDFLSNIYIEKHNNNTEGKQLIVLITSMYNVCDDVTNKMMADAAQFSSKYGYNVLIINTKEYLGGRRIALEEEVCDSYNDEILNESVIYMGERYPFIQCNAEMPDAEYIEKVCSTLADYNIVGIVTYDSMSLLAEACKSIGLVEYRYGIVE